MKYLQYIALVLLFLNCEDVIEVNLNDAPPRLVIDASINWFKGTVGNTQSIKLSLSAPFYTNGVPPANQATVSITNEDTNETFLFLEDGSSGIYKNNTFNPIINNTYTLTVVYNDEVYSATETFVSVVPLDYVEQNTSNGFGDEEEIELKAFYTDPANEDNYYFFEFISDVAVIPTLEVYDDEFTNGNQIFGFYSEEDLEPNDAVTIRNYGISKRFYEFMFLLLQQGSEDTDGPFQTQPASVRGNCVNTTNASNYPYGYFRLSEVDEIVYTIQ